MLILLPTYIGIPCPTLYNPMDGAVSMTECLFGDIVTYTCDYGFELSGDVMRICQSDGTWTGSAPICNRKHNIQYNLVIHCVDCFLCRYPMSNPG